MEADRVPPGRRPRQRIRGRAGRRRRRRRAPRVHHLRRPRRDQRDQPQGLAQRVRGGGRARARRLVYTSSVAAYGFHDDNPDVLTEDVPPRGTRDFYYSAQKAELEALLDDVAGESATDTYVFRPCIVAGRDAPTLSRASPVRRSSARGCGSCGGRSTPPR